MIQYRDPNMVVCDLESDRDLSLDIAVVVHTLESGSPALAKGHWWRCRGLSPNNIGTFAS